VTRKVEETDIVMAEVEAVSQQYLSLASACSSIYFTMEALNQVILYGSGNNKELLGELYGRVGTRLEA